MNYGYVVLLVGIFTLSFTCGAGLHWRKLRRIVFANLDSAREGCQFTKIGYLYGLPSYEIAADMELYCEDCSGYDRNQILPHVQAWLKRNAEKVYPT